METVTGAINKSPATDTQTHANSSCSIHKPAGSTPPAKAGQLQALSVLLTPGTADFSMDSMLTVSGQPQGAACLLALLNWVIF